MWVIERQYCSGNQCARNIYTVESRDDAINKVLGQLEWDRNVQGLRFVMQDGQECFEDQATAELYDGQFEYTTASDCHITYRLFEK